jgi:nucleoside-diphosphate-sugar epimerase
VKVFVVGGTGAIGRPAVSALVRDGHDVRALARTERRADELRQRGATPVRVSMFDVGGLAGAFADHDAVVNVASAMPSTLQFVRLRAWRETERVRTRGSAAVVDAALRAGVPRLIQESVVMLYADQGAAWIDEDGPVDHYPMAGGNHAAEASAHRFTAAGGTAVILRLGLFYGPGARHSEQFLALARRGIVPLFGRGGSYLSSIHVDDGGRAAAAALEAPSGVFNVVDDQPLTKREFADALAVAANRRRSIRGPGRAALLLGHRTTSLTRSVRASNERFKRATGWSPDHPSAREGWLATAAALERSRS